MRNNLKKSTALFSMLAINLFVESQSARATSASPWMDKTFGVDGVAVVPFDTVDGSQRDDIPVGIAFASNGDLIVAANRSSDSGTVAEVHILHPDGSPSPGGMFQLTLHPTSTVKGLGTISSGYCIAGGTGYPQQAVIYCHRTPPLSDVYAIRAGQETWEGITARSAPVGGVESIAAVGSIGQSSAHTVSKAVYEVGPAALKATQLAPVDPWPASTEDGYAIGFTALNTLTMVGAIWDGKARAFWFNGAQNELDTPPGQEMSSFWRLASSPDGSIQYTLGAQFNGLLAYKTLIGRRGRMAQGAPGLVDLDGTLSSDVPVAGAVDQSGRLYVVGYPLTNAGYPSGEKNVLARFLTDGQLDNSWGGDGRVSLTGLDRSICQPSPTETYVADAALLGDAVAVLLKTKCAGEIDYDAIVVKVDGTWLFSDGFE